MLSLFSPAMYGDVLSRSCEPLVGLWGLDQTCCSPWAQVSLVACAPGKPQQSWTLRNARSSTVGPVPDEGCCSGLGIWDTDQCLDSYQSDGQVRIRVPSALPSPLLYHFFCSSESDSPPSTPVRGFGGYSGSGFVVSWACPLLEQTSNSSTRGRECNGSTCAGCAAESPVDTFKSC